MSYAQPLEGFKRFRKLAKNRMRFTPTGQLMKRSRMNQHALACHAGLSGILDFPSIQSAIDYVKAKVGEFFQLPYQYTQAKKRITRALAAAKAKNDNVTVAKLSAIDAGVNKLQGDYGPIESKVKWCP